MVVTALTGIDLWNEYTEPCIRSIRKHEPEANIVCVDNGSKVPYPIGHRIERTSYAGFINYVVREFDADWYLILNNDVLCTAPYLSVIEELYDDCNYGNHLLRQDDVVWIEAWSILFSKKSYDKIGEWDEKFLMGGFEDADWGIRATKNGVGQMPLELPFKHFGGKTRWDIENYSETRLNNMQYLFEKHGLKITTPSCSCKGD